MTRPFAIKIRALTPMSEPKREMGSFNPVNNELAVISITEQHQSALSKMVNCATKEDNLFIFLPQINKHPIRIFYDLTIRIRMLDLHFYYPVAVYFFHILYLKKVGQVKSLSLAKADFV